MIARPLPFILLVISVLPILLAFGQQGFISLDCGLPDNLSYTDNFGYLYISDAGSIDSGQSKQVASNFMTTERLYQTLRTFPNYTRNCYNLMQVREGGRYLIRASFLYGNYDGLNLLPIFDLYVGVDRWTTVNLDNASHVFWTEITTKATANSLSVCLVKTAGGTPFISALEVRPLDNDLYINSSESTYLITYKRVDTGSLSGSTRFKEDSFDRMWTPDYNTYGLPVSTNRSMSFYYQIPVTVGQTAESSSKPIVISWTGEHVGFHIFMYFGEVLQLQPNQTRNISIDYNGEKFLDPFTLENTMTVWSISPLEENQYTFTISTTSTTFGPIINAFEIYKVYDVSGYKTDSGDVDAISGVKTYYNLKRNWFGDPCLPQSTTWDGLNCTYSNPATPRIISLDLSNSELNGTIIDFLGQLTQISSLNLSTNNLQGSIPGFLATLNSLAMLDLSNNDLSGSVPSALLQRVNEGSLTLRLENNPHLCQTGSCKNSRTWLVPVVVVASFICLVMILGIFGVIIVKHKTSKPDSTAATDLEAHKGSDTLEPSSTLAEESMTFTYAEIVEITKNFNRVIGIGGSGTVYYGLLSNDREVAVKKLKETTPEGDRQFITEVQLLMAVHHRNLVSFIGYCNEGNNLILVYEYMTRGNLRELLSANQIRSTVLTWELRLQIALDAASGLEYLHHGCRKTIIHRDVKTSNILLNENLEGKLADFGLCKTKTADGNAHTTTRIAGTPGYIDPEYSATNMLTVKSDIYSFGVVLLEIISGQNVILTIDGQRVHIVDWAKSMVSEGNVLSIADRRMQWHFNIQSLWEVTKLAMLCTSQISNMRPDTRKVVEELKNAQGMESSHEVTESSEVEPERKSGPSYASNNSTMESTYNTKPR